MIVDFIGASLHTKLFLKDKQDLDEKGTIECKFLDNESINFGFHVVEKISKNYLEDILEEPWIHLEHFPQNAERKDRVRYDLYLTKEKFKELTSNLDTLNSNYISSRNKYDRTEIFYYDY